MSGTDETALKVHVDSDGVVWHLVGSSAPARTGLSVSSYALNLEAGAYRPSRHVRVVGTADNALLLLALDELKRRDAISSLQVCSPLVCPKAQYHDPTAVLFNMRQWVGRAPSQGGWHEFGLIDRPSYEIAVAANTYGVDDVRMTQLLKCHPVWPYLSFIPHLNPGATAHLLGLVVDPRWYIDPVRPDRGARLASHLGMTSGYVNAESAYGAKLKRRYELVLRAWKSVPPNVKQLAQPRYFLWRTWDTHGQDGSGDLKASTRFINYLRYVWLDVIYRQSKQLDRLFDPELFFGRADEIEAFTEHVRQIDADWK